MGSECPNYRKIEFRKGWNVVDETEEDDAWNSMEAIFAIISNGQFYYEIPGRIRVTETMSINKFNEILL